MNIVPSLGTPSITIPLRKIVCPPIFTGMLLKTPLAGSLPFAAFNTARTVFSCPPNFDTKGPRIVWKQIDEILCLGLSLQAQQHHA